MKRIAVVGGGVSGLSAAHFLKDRFHVKVFEKESKVGGLIRCKRVNGSLFHICGGHVFNSKRQDVLEWFWSFFDKNLEFVKTDRNSSVYMGKDLYVPYPIENHVYFLSRDIQESFIEDLLEISKTGNAPQNFEEFLTMRFGKTLYDLYFRPYNEKVWRRDLRQVPLSWLEGKLPMPTVQEMIYNNMNHIEEKSFVHSTFFYEKDKGSQFIADRLACGLDISCDINVESIEFVSDGFLVNGEKFDKVIFCGNIKQLPILIKNFDIEEFVKPIDSLEYHGTTSVFCEIDKNPYSWIYLPDKKTEAHRIICTGNFSESNNAIGKMTATVEFTDFMDKNDIDAELKKTPLNPKYLDHHYNEYTYPIQDHRTKDLIRSLKMKLQTRGFYFTGRFADWEYYNMDIAMGASMDICKIIE